ncbi:MAG: hypothetical protein A3J28_05195 [Acidobacteria bacterium RIFCSPLOWO2_12_FULL_60_22]|nr:MAG: hypothetical protein A3J28_05195 [Acidobacteria bacterium RIFCSPLOWO2_12_FULL_60_22]
MKVVGRTIVVGAMVCAAIGIMTLVRTERRVAAQQTGSATNKSDQGITGPYNVDPNWPKPVSTWPGHEGWTWGSTQGVFVENSNRIFVAMRGELPELLPPPQQDLNLVQLKGRFGPVAVQYPGMRSNSTSDSPGEQGPYAGRVEGKDYRWEHIISVFDSQGNLKEETNAVWKQWDSLFKPADIPDTARGRVHKILISPYDPEMRIWAVDDGNQVIRIFSNDGKRLLQTIGTLRTTTERNAIMTGNTGRPSLTKKSGPANQTFGRQTDIAWLPDGTFFVSDGYEETRVVKFDKDGKFLMAWGERGEAGGNEKRPGYFNTVHGIVTDKQRRIYVDDRTNHRVQIFDENGKFLDQWYFGPYATIYHMYIEADQQHIWMSDTRGLMLKYDLKGNMVYSWGAWGVRPGEMWGVHQFGVDERGNLYTSEVHSGKPQKFTPKPGADRAKLVGQPLRVAWK